MRNTVLKHYGYFSLCFSHIPACIHLPVYPFLPLPCVLRRASLPRSPWSSHPSSTSFTGGSRGALRDRAPRSNRLPRYWTLDASPVSWVQGFAGRTQDGPTHTVSLSEAEAVGQGSRTCRPQSVFLWSILKGQQFCRKPFREFLRQCSH